MKYIEAIKLHNEDEVISKKTGEVLTVLNTKIIDKTVYLDCVDAGNGLIELTHKEVM